MGTTNNIRETNITLKLVGLVCDNCGQKFTEQEIRDRNYETWFDTTSDVQLEDRLSNGYYLSIRIRSIEHQDCPEIIEDHERSTWAFNKDHEQ